MKFARNLLYRIAVIVVIVEMVFGPLVPVADIAIAQAASIPTILSYQGRLTDSSGSLLGGAGTNYYFKFSLWSSATIGSGSKLWPTAAPSSFASVVKQGVFNVNIGDTANGYPDSLDYNFANATNLYLQVEVSSDNSSFETLSPRQLVSSAAFSQVSGAVSGVNASSFGTTSQLSNSVVSIVSTTSTAVGLTVRGAASQSSNIFNIQDYLGGNLLSVTASGGLQVSSLTSCDTIDTDVNGNFVCGTDNGSTWATSSDSFAFDTRLAATTTLNNITTLLGLSDVIATNATVTNLTLGSDYITDLTGSGLAVVNGALTALGDGTFSTTSATYWDSLQNRWSTTSNDYYLTTKSTTDLSEGSNLYWTDNRFDARLSGTTSLPNINTLVGLATIGSSTGTTTVVGGFSAAASLYVLQNGNIGIGTSSPGSAVTVESSNASVTKVSVKNTVSTGAGSFQALNSDADNIEFLQYGRSAAGTYFGVSRAGGAFLGGSPNTLFGIGTRTATPLLFATNNLERIRILSSGEVGIGTTSPYQKLSVAGNVIADTFIATSTTATSTFPLLSANALSLNGTYVTSFWATSSDALAFDTRLAATTTLNNINNLGGLATIGSSTGTTTLAGAAIFNGNVGIGTTDPKQKLDVYGGVIAISGGVNSNKSLYVGRYGSQSASHVIEGNSNGLELRPSNSENIILNTAGNIGVGTTSPYAKLAVDGRGIFNQDVRANYFTATSTTATSTFPLLSTNALSLNGTYVTSFWATSSDSLAFDTRLAATSTLNNINNLGGLATIGSSTGTTTLAGAAIFNGNVGIGTTTPLYPLEVNGSLKATYIGVNDTPGLNGWVLRVNGKSWVNGQIAGVSSSIGSGYSSAIVPTNGVIIEGRVGIGTTSPYQKLSVAGNVIADTFIATSTTATSTFPLLSTNSLSLNGQYVTSLWATSSSDYHFITNLSATTSLPNLNTLAGLATIGSTTGTTTLAGATIFNGNVGIGTSSPSSKLHVTVGAAGSIAAHSQSILTLESNTNQAINMLAPTAAVSSIYFGNPTYGSLDGRIRYDNTSRALDFWTANAARMIINASGNVGIGTTSPSAKLAVTGTVGTSDVFAVASSTEARLFTINYAGQAGLGVLPATTSGVTLDVSGNIRGGRNYSSAGTLAFPNFAASSNNFPGLYSAGTNLIGLVTNAVERLRVDAVGNVGIGTTTPYAKLSVVGQTVSEYFTATSTTATSTFPLLSTNALSLNGQYVTSFWATSSSDYWETLQNRWATTSSDYYLTTKSTTDIAEGSNLYWTDNRFDARLSATTSLPNLNTLAGLATIGSSTGTTTLAGTTLFGDGSTAFPGIAFSADTNTGLARTGSDAIALVTSGFSRLSISAIGSVAISQTLSVSGSSNFATSLGTVGVGTSSPFANLAVNPIAGQAANQFVVGSSTGTSFIINNAGNVGIGTNAPTTPLHIYSTNPTGLTIERSSSANANLLFKNSVGSTYAGLIPSGVGFGIGASNDLTSASFAVITAGVNAGNVGIGSTSPYQKLSVAGNVIADTFIATSTTATSTFPLLSANALSLNGTYVTSFWATSSDALAFDIRLAATSTLNNINNLGGLATIGSSTGTTTFFGGSIFNGNVGIGTTTPQDKLSIAGTITSTPAPGAGSTNDKILKINNGSGSERMSLGYNASQVGLNINDSSSNPLFYFGSNGFFGIGSSTPNSPISVSGNVRLTTITAGRGIFADNGSNAGIFSLTRQDTVATADLSIAAYGGIGFKGGSTNYNNAVASGYAMYLTSGGNLAIGTTSSVKKLSILDTAAPQLLLTGNGSDGSGVYIGSVNEGANTNEGAISFGSEFAFAGGAISSWTARATSFGALHVDNGDLNYYADSGLSNGTTFTPTSRLTVLQAGNIGIGTTSPYQKLSVAGNVIADTFIATSTTATSTFPLLSANALSLNGTYVTSFWATSSDALAFDTRLAATTTLNNITNLAGLSNIGSTSGITNLFGNIGVGSSSPFAALAVNAVAGQAANQFVVGSSTGTSFIINNAGKVGIGTSTPDAAYPLSIYGLAGGALKIGRSDVPGYTYTITEPSGSPTVVHHAISGATILTLSTPGSSLPKVGIGSTTPFATLSVTNTGTDPSFLVEDSASPDSTPFIIDASGNVGVGSTTPSAKLSVTGTGASTGRAFVVADSANADRFIVKDNGTTEMWLANNFMSLKEYSTSFAGLYNNKNLRLESGSAAGIWFKTNGTDQMVLDSSGNLGIGTTSPYAALAVSSVAGQALNQFAVGSTTSTGFVIDNAGNIAVGTNPSASHRLYVYGGSSNIARFQGTGTQLTLTYGGGSFPNFTFGVNSAGNLGMLGGNVGIGTTTSYAKLAVVGQTVSEYFTATSTTATSTFPLLAADALSLNGTYVTSFWATSSDALAFDIRLAATSTLNNINNLGGLATIGSTTGTTTFFGGSIFNGNVGIGTTTPEYKFSMLDGAISLRDSNQVDALPAISTTLVDNEINGYLGENSNRGLLRLSAGGRVSSLNKTAIDLIGFGSTDSNVIAMYTAGIEKLRINSSGNVGIGTTSPAYKLDSWGDIAAQNISSSNIAMRLLRGGTEYGAMYSLASDSNFYLRATQSSGALNLQTGGSNTRMTIDNSGKVGIGTTSPYQKLSVAGNVIADTFIATSTTATSTFPLLSANALSLNGTYVTSFWATSSDALAFDTRLAATSTLNNINNLGGLATIGSTTGTTTLAGATIFNGNVGIGTTNPNAKLHVSGGNGALPTLNTGTTLLVQNNANTTDRSRIAVIGGTSGYSTLELGTSATQGLGGLQYDNSLNILSILASGAAKISVVGSTGNIGIGTTTPDAKLTINNGAYSGNLLSLNGSEPDAYGLTLRNSSTISGVVSYAFDTKNITTYSNNLVLDRGRVGIGTSTPVSELQLASTLPSLYITDTDSGTNAKHWFMENNAGVLSFGTSTDALSKSDTRGLKITNAGQVQIGSPSMTSSSLLVDGGSGGGSMITLRRTSGTTQQYSWALGGGGLSFFDDTNGYVTTNMFGDTGMSQLFVGQRGVTITNSRASILSATTFNSGTDVNGTAFEIIGSRGTGAGIPGDLKFSVGLATGSGSTQQSTSTRMVISGLTGYVGIGTTSPYSPLSVNGTTTALLFQATSTTATSSLPLLSVNALSVNGVYANSLWSTTSDTYAFNALLAATTTLNNLNNLGGLATIGSTTGTTTFLSAAIFNRSVGIGTSSPVGLLNIASTLPYLYITDTNAATDNKHWFFENNGGVLGFGTSTDSLALTSSRALSITNAGTMTVAGSVYTSGGGAAGVGTKLLATTDYVQSRGTNLVTNGSGLLKNNYNFSSFTFDPIETHGGGGSFSKTGSVTALSDEFIPVDSQRTYRQVVWAKSGDTGGANYDASNKQYIGISLYDADGYNITPGNSTKYSGSTDTTLAAQLNPGDTTVTLTDATGWYNGATYSNRHFAWWPYTNSAGYSYPNYTYTRNVSSAYSSNSSSPNGTWSQGGISGNTITLRVAWAGPTLPVGTPLRNSPDGSTYKYISASNVTVPNEWTRYEGYLNAPAGDGIERTNDFRAGTANVKFLFLVNYQVAPTNYLRVSDLWFSELSADNLELASISKQGVVSTTTQTFGGIKTFANDTIFSSKIGIGTSTPYAQVSVASGAIGTTTFALRPISGQTANIFDIYSTTGTLSSVISASGDWGIGTSSPSQKLQISGQSALPASSGSTQTGIMRLVPNGVTPALTATLDFGVYNSTGAGWIQSGNLTALGTNYALLLNPNGGNVGIGTTSPRAKLDIAGTNNATVPLFQLSSVSAFATTTRVLVDNNGNVGIGSSTPTNKLSISVANSSNVLDGLMVDRGSGTNAAGFKLVSDAGGIYHGAITWKSTTLPEAEIISFGTHSTGPNPVGIGTTTPAAKLDIFNTYSSATAALFSIASSTAGAGTSTALYVAANGLVGIGTSSPTNTLHISSANATPLKIERTTAGNSNIQYTAAGTGTFYAGLSDAGAFGIGTSGSLSTAFLTVASAGNVGIGTTSPYSPLSVNGTTTALLFQATSTTATSSLPLLSVNALSVNGVYANSLWSTTSDTYAFNALLAATTTLNNITTLGSLSLPITQTTGTLSVARGGTGQTAFGQGWLGTDGTTITSSTSPTVAYITATSTATSTFGGSIALYGASNPAGNIFFSAANPFIKASSYILIPGGAFFNSGTVYFGSSLKARGGIANDTGQVLSITGGLAGLTAFTGNTGVGTSTATSRFTVASVNGTSSVAFLTVSTSSTALATSTLFIVDGFGNTGVGTSTPFANFAINPVAGQASNQFVVGSSTGTNFIINNAGNVGIGSTSPYQKLSVAGNVIADTFIATSTIATSTFPLLSTNSLSLNGQYVTSLWATSSSDYHFITNLSATTTLNGLNTLEGLATIGSTTGTTTLAGATIFNGNVGIGTETPTSKLALTGGNFTHVAEGDVTLAGFYDTSMSSLDVYVSGKYAYVADNTNGLKIIDISNKATPTLVGSYNTSGTAAGVYVSGKYAYVADGTAGLKVVDVSNPVSPALTGTFSSSDLAYDVYVSGKYAYVADGTAGLRIVDISNPAAPVLKGSYNTLGIANGIYVSGKYAYVADGGSGLQIIDISDPAVPVLTGTYDSTNAMGIYVSGKYAYIADTGNGMEIVDISDPAAPSFVGNYSTTGSAREVYVAGDYAYVSGSTDMEIIDISDPTSPQNITSYSSDDIIFSTYVSGKYAYVADYTAGLKVIDINGIKTPSLYAGNINTNALTVTENVDIGNNLYVRNGLNVGQGGIFADGVFTVGDISATSTFPLLSAKALSLNGTYVTSFWATSSDALAFDTRLAATTTLNNITNLAGLSNIGSTSGITNLFGNIGVGSSSPFAALAVNAVAGQAANRFVVGSSTGTSFIINNSGKVGVGTTSPVSELTVANSGGVGSVSLGSVYASSAAYGGITLNGSPAGNNYNFLSSPTDTNLYINRPSGKNIIFREANSSVASNIVTITTGTLFGIGTSSPGAKFDLINTVGGSTPLFSVASSTSGAGTTTALFITSNGNTGVGTTSGAYRMTVDGGANAAALMVTAKTGSANSGVLLDLANYGDGPTGIRFLRYPTSGGVAAWTMGQDSINNDAFTIGRGANYISAIASSSKYFALTTTGNLGLGTTSPIARFDMLNIAGGSTPLLSIASSTSGLATSTALYVAANGNVGMGTTSPVANLHVYNDSGNAISVLNRRAGLFMSQYAGQGSVGLLYDSTGSFIIGSQPLSSIGTTNSFTTRMIVTSTGNVGIGTSTPQALLSVIGGNLEIGTTTGANVGNITIGGARLLNTYTPDIPTGASTNLFFGKNAGNYTLTGTNGQNAGFGAETLANLTTGVNNAIVGFRGGNSITSGSNNAGIGGSSCRSITTGLQNTCLGYLAGFTGQVGTVSFSTAIGTGAYTSRSNSMVLGGVAGDYADVALGTTTPWAKFSIQGAVGSTTVLFDIASSTSAAFATSSLFRVDSNGLVGIGTTTPFATLAVNPVAGQAQNQFVVGSSTKTNFIVTNTGNVGIGMTNPAVALDVTSGTASNNVIRVNASAANGNSSFVANRTLTSNNSSLHFSTAGTNDWIMGMPYTQFGTSGSDFNIIDGSNNIRFLINKTTGFVGVGSSTPNNKLSVSVANSGSLSDGLVVDRGSGQNAAGFKLVSDAGGIFHGAITWKSTTLSEVEVISFGSHSSGINPVGIGTTTPAAKLDIFNTTSSATAPLFSVASSTSGAGTTTALVITANGSVGIASSTPWRTLSLSGTAAFSGLTTAAGTPNSLCINAVTKEITENAATSCVVSDRDQKQQIQELSVSGLDALRKIQPVTFAYNDRPDRNRIGFIAQDLQSVDDRLGDAFDKNHIARSIDIPAIMSITVKAVKELDTKVTEQASTTAGLLSILKIEKPTVPAATSTTPIVIDTQTNRIDELENRIKLLESASTTMATSSVITTIVEATTTASSTIETISNWFVSLGVQIKEGVMHVVALVTDSLKTKSLTVEPDAENLASAGITILDRTTGKPVCMFVADGIMKTELGRCGEKVATTTPEVTLPQATPAVIPEVVVSSTTPIVASSTPEVVVSTSTPVVEVPAPVVSTTSEPVVVSTPEPVPAPEAATSTEPNPQP